MWSSHSPSQTFNFLSFVLFFLRGSLCWVYPSLWSGLVMWVLFFWLCRPGSATTQGGSWWPVCMKRNKGGVSIIFCSFGFNSQRQKNHFITRLHHFYHTAFYFPDSKDELSNLCNSCVSRMFFSPHCWLSVCRWCFLLYFQQRATSISDSRAALICIPSILFRLLGGESKGNCGMNTEQSVFRVQIYMLFFFIQLWWAAEIHGSRHSKKEMCFVM